MTLTVIRDIRTVISVRYVWSFFLCLLASTVIIVSLSGCGYHRAERGESLPCWIKSIYVAPWANRSNEFLLGVWITDELRREFLKGSALDLVTKDQADVILEGKVESTSTSGLSYVRYDEAIERRIIAECSVRLVQRESGKVLWETVNIVREETFLVKKDVKDVMKTEGNKDEALRKLSRNVAEIVYHRIAGVF